MKPECPHGIPIYNPCSICIEQATGRPFRGSVFSTPLINENPLESENRALKARVEALEGLVEMDEIIVGNIQNECDSLRARNGKLEAALKAADELADIAAYIPDGWALTRPLKAYRLLRAGL